MEIGRSMVEMIGVLAIAGILSIGAVVGYNYAMILVQSNQIKRDVNMITHVFKIEVLKQVFENKSYTPDELSIPVVADVSYKVFSFENELDMVKSFPLSKRVCQELLKSSLPFVQNIRSNIDTTMTCDEGDNEVTFFFNEISECSVCIGNECVDKDALCSADQVCLDGVCRKCPKGQFWTQGFFAGESHCESCSDFTAHYVETRKDCYQCANHFFVMRDETTPVCYGCQENTYSLYSNRITTIEDCNRCINRYFDKPTQTCKICPDGTHKNSAGTGCV